MFKNKAALRETLVDIGLGTLMNFPINLLAVWTIFKLNMTVVQSSVFLWFIFTTVAIIRKYHLRVYFEKKSKDKLTSDKKPL